MKASRAVLLLLAGTTLSVGPAAGQDSPASTAHPANWPAAKSVGLIDPAIEKRVDELLAKLSLEQKVGQMIQGDTSSIKPEELRKYPLGSILAGGSSPPLGAPDRSPIEPWLATAQAFRAVSLEQRPGYVPIPNIFGIDAVHGNSNIVGATIFPHNIGLGAANDPALIEKIGRITALETAAAGIDWAFGPTLAVPQDDRWGRAYEGYSEKPDISKAYAKALIDGLQGARASGTIQQGHVAASAKHFLGDGGTTGGIDQGDTQVDEKTLIVTHAQGYIAAIDAGVMTVMASYNSWNGEKMHGNKSMLTDVLKGKMGFDGFIVSDWNGHAQIPGCTRTDCARGFNAGIDMVMAPDTWKGLYESTLAQAKSGAIPMARIDDAVRRILRVKFKLGLFDAARPYDGRAELMGAPEHRAVAREAVRKSLVLLKNNGGVLPIRGGAKLLVAGPAANDMGPQTGGWTLSWQGDGNKRSDFPNAQTIWEGIDATMRAQGGSATLSADGSFATKPDVAIVVFGEAPYAEMRGDIRSLEFEPGDKQALATLKKLKAAGIPTVSVFLSGRPLWVNPEINASDAFVAAWLPGSEGGGIADVLIGDKAGKPRHDFQGRLSFSWPNTAGQFVLNPGQPNYDPLFAYGFGLDYRTPGKPLGALSEVSGVDASLSNRSVFFARGATPAPFSASLGAGITRSPVDSATQQEGAIRLAWTAAAPAAFTITGPELDWSRESNADLSLRIVYRVDAAPKGPVELAVPESAPGKGLPATAMFSRRPGEWQTAAISLKCFATVNPGLKKVASPLRITAAAPFTVSIADARIVSDPNASGCPE
ncbi:exo 1,3/1,4-beta-D-glucan glucohydrolase [Sphingomonas sp. BT-65]|uniref:glycoside hydrolase family 3 protein n=1 Tax=Sphingomonas sp. BT-65 TaxID=2989821 RepID=UPI00223671B0|nr:glycoside hydrolase family 3 protein [Sphingomonas sp. BT-65]MCW4461984.1 exo 1,3/1,4-beta-D-glucan glucohydrolase [Sphingomonas sp. BT-65]